jgi:hypothetical protein
MKLGDYEFEYVCDIEPVRETDGTLRQHMPQDRYKNARNLPLNRYGGGPFCKFGIPNRFRVSGVYVLTVDEELRYVGECANLSARFNAGYGNISPKNCFRGGQGDEPPLEQSPLCGVSGRPAYIAVVFPDCRLQVSGSGHASHPEPDVEPDMKSRSE